MKFHQLNLFFCAFLFCVLFGTVKLFAQEIYSAAAPLSGKMENGQLQNENVSAKSVSKAKSDRIVFFLVHPYSDREVAKLEKFLMNGGKIKEYKGFPEKSFFCRLDSQSDASDFKLKSEERTYVLLEKKVILSLPEDLQDVSLAKAKSISAAGNSIDEFFVMNIQLSENGRKKFAAITRQNIGRKMAVVDLNKGRVIANPQINVAVNNGRMSLFLPEYWTLKYADDFLKRISQRHPQK